MTMMKETAIMAPMWEVALATTDIFFVIFRFLPILNFLHIVFQHRFLELYFHKNLICIVLLVFYLLQFFAMINISLGIFNLIPIPPLDGSRIVGSFLSANAYIGYMKVERYGFYIILGILALDRILSVVTGNPTLFSQALDFVYRFLFDGILKLIL